MVTSRRVAPSLLIATAFLAVASAQDSPKPERREIRSKIDDRAGLFEKSTVERVVQNFEEIERRSGTPIVIETVASLNGEPIEEAAAKAARASGSTGLFILIAKAERRIARPLVGQPFEQKIPEEQREKIREAILEGFKAGDFDRGLKNGMGQIMMALREPPAAKPAPSTSALVDRDRVKLTLAGARKALDAAEAKAAEMNFKMNIAVVDDGGHLLAFARMDGARPASAPTAQTKAVSAATFRQATGPLSAGAAPPDLLLNLSVPAAAALGGGRITPLLGGLPIEVDGQVIGAVGVGGGSGEQDAQVARAGVEALLKEINAKETNAKAAER